MRIVGECTFAQEVVINTWRFDEGALRLGDEVVRGRGKLSRPPLSSQYLSIIFEILVFYSTGHS
jgi:hypothetical protein